VEVRSTRNKVPVIITKPQQAPIRQNQVKISSSNNRMTSTIEYDPKPFPYVANTNRSKRLKVLVPQG
jgi:hypothetical protein